MKRPLLIALCLALLASCAPVSERGGSGSRTLSDISQTIQEKGGYTIRAAVLYSTASPSGTWRTTLDHLTQSTLVDLEAEAVNIRVPYDLSGYDVVYLDPSILETLDFHTLEAEIMAYTSAGGYVFAPNGFYDRFPADYFGALSFEKLEEYPDDISAPRLPEDLSDLADIQELIGDFHKMYAVFADAIQLRRLDYGYAMRPSSAVSLIDSEGQSLYSVNQYGEGYVLFANPLLPNAFIQADFSLEERKKGQFPFADTAAAFDRLMVNEWAAFASKRVYGFALDRVYGCYGSPSMSWELHYEDISGMENDSLITFSELCREYGQIPSFSIVRNPYNWFLRAESLTYLLNRGNNWVLNLQMDYNENAYASGTHVAAGGRWLAQDTDMDTGSFFADNWDYTCRLYPYVLDYDGDGDPDFFCGSRDGGITYYDGWGMGGLEYRLKVAPGVPVTDLEGNPLSVGTFSAPQLVDLDGDEVLDLASGSYGGAVYWFKGNGTTAFRPMGKLLQANITGQVLPSFGDVDGDGVTDMALGTDMSIFLIFWGEEKNGRIVYSNNNSKALSRYFADNGLTGWLAPCLADLNADEHLDLLVGTFDGYIAQLEGEGEGNFRYRWMLDCQEENYKGNNHIKFGNFCVPTLYDIDGDRDRDLVCGQQEYGMAYPVDSAYFPAKEALRKQVEYALENHIYLGPHLLTGAHYSARREEYELSRHLESLAYYGIPTDTTGTNQHTWYTATGSPSQTLGAIYNAGLLWQSGYAPSGATNHAPQSAAESVLSLPFFLTEKGEKTLLVQNVSVLPYRPTEWTDISGKYRMPVCMYYHCDFVYESDDAARDILEKAADFRDKFAYNFTREDQHMKAVAAACNLKVRVEAAEGGFVLTPEAESRELALYDEDYQAAAGLRVDFADDVTERPGTDASVWKYDEGDYIIGLDKPVTVARGLDIPASRIEQVNLPADIRLTGDGVELTFLSDGLMQVVVSGSAATDSPGWTAETRKDGRTVFTAYGAPTRLNIQYGQGAEK